MFELRKRLSLYIQKIFPRTLGTIHYTFSLLFVLATLAGVAAVVTATASQVRITVSSTSVVVGERTFIDVFVDAHTPINAVNISINVNNPDLEVVGVNRGQSVLTIWTEDPKVENGIVTLSGGTFQRGFIGEHLIATIVVIPKKSGKIDVVLASAEFYAGDGQGTPVVARQIPKTTFIAYDTATENVTIKEHLTKLSDIDGDGRVSIRDISIFMAAWSDRSVVYDFDGDGKMTFRDFSIILSMAYQQTRLSS
jgi:hypothetical protein